jgi:hypothetical protein
MYPQCDTRTCMPCSFVDGWDSLVSPYPGWAWASGGQKVTIHGYGFNPASTYRCVFTSGPNTSIVTADFVSSTEALCTTPCWGCLQPASDDVLITFVKNGANRLIYTAGGYEDVTSAPKIALLAAWSGVSPRVGKAAGGETITLSGKGLSFSTVYVCQFSAQGFVVNSTAPAIVDTPETMRCVTPAFPFGTQYTTVSVLGLPFIEGGDASLATYLFVSSWLSKTVHAGPFRGGTTVVINGGGLMPSAGYVFIITCLLL